MSNNDRQKSDPNQMTFLEHLGELRKRILHSLLFILLAFIACFYLSDALFEYATGPFKELMPENADIIGTGVAEAFTSRMLIAAVAALVLSSPFWFYQVWLFVSPGLYKKEKRLAIPFVFFATIFFVGGVAFGYFLVLPLGFQFFLDQYESAGLTPQIRIIQYFSFVARLLIAFGVCFELPVISFLLGRLGIITWRHLVKWARYALLVIFIGAAILTPPDVASQVLLGAPILFMYGLSILLVALTGKRKPSGEETSD